MKMLKIWAIVSFVLFLSFSIMSSAGAALTDWLTVSDGTDTYAVRIRDRYRKRRRYIERVYGRKVRKYRYHFRITRDRGAFASFYDKLYVPYITSRYVGRAWLRSAMELRSAVKSGFLLQVYKDDRWVSGGVCRLKDAEIVTYAFGLAPDYSYHLHRGALSAFYYFVVKWAKDHGITTIDLRRCRPDTNDGVYRHKHRWGAEPVMDIWNPAVIWIFAGKGSRMPAAMLNHLVWDGQRFADLRSQTE